MRSGEAAAEIADKLRVSRSLAARAVRQWGVPLIRRSRRCVVYPPTIVHEVVKRILAGDWPKPPQSKRNQSATKESNNEN